MKKFSKSDRKKFAPLQRYEDRQRAIWFFLGGMTAIAVYVIVCL